jgi:hypothetical protein
MTALVSRRSSRGLDLFGRFDRYNTVNSDAESDSEAVANDWQAVGDDLWAAYEQVKPK